MYSLGDVLSTAFAFGLVYFTLFYSFGNNSLCHFNPAVSLAMTIEKRITVKDFFLYFLSQLIGGIIGAIFLKLIIPNDSANYATYVTELCCNGDIIAGLFVETIIAYLFVLTFLGANSKSRNKNIRGLVICGGMIVVAMVSSILNYSIVNPVKAIATAIPNNEWSSLPIFIIGPFIGSLLAVYHFRVINKKDDENN